MGKKLESQNDLDAPESKPTHNESQNRAAEESKDNEIIKENFTLQLKVKEQEEAIKSSNEIISLYKDHNAQLQTQQQQAQGQVNNLYLQIIQTTNKATAYGISAIALFVILILIV
jgi:molecular chaperone GrpE (heat shock protein)